MPLPPTPASVRASLAAIAGDRIVQDLIDAGSLILTEEALAYLVGDKGNADLPLFRRILAAVRAFLTRAGFKLDLTTDDLVLLAQSALETAAQREVRAGAITKGVLGRNEEDAEAARQYAEVVARYTNPDGSKKAGWLKAPNGQPTKLNERQWVQVRTENFKRWFGDWEAAELRARILASPVEQASTRGLSETGPYKVLRAEAKALYHGPLVVINRETRQAIRVEESSLDNALQHGMNVQKRSVVAVLDKLIENAVFVVRDTENMRQGIAAIETFAAQVVVDGEPFIARLVVREVGDGRRFYDHELSTLESERPTGNSGGSIGSVASRPLPRPSVSLGKKILNAALEVNPAEVSKVIAANGEPLVVYHGTDQETSTLSPDRSESEFGTFFTTSREAANEYAETEGGNVLPVFLRIKNPYQVTNQQWANAEGLSPEEADQQNHDGYAISGMDGGDTWIAFSKTSAKSAIANTGAFSPVNPDIRYAVALGLAEPTLTADELLARVQSGDLAELTPEQWAQVQQAFLGQAATVATGVNAPTFETWFGQSKIKSKTGQPVVMYHGTPEAFTVFDAARSGANTTHPTAALGFFFTNDQGHAAAKYGQNVMEVYLAIEKPYAMTDADLRRIESLDDAKAFRARLEAQGYDGIVMPAETGTRYVAAFRSDQIKFTNNASYTRGQPDMRFALASPRTGQAPGLFEKAPVVVTQLTGKEISTDNQPWNLRNAVKAFAQKYRGQSFPNIDTQTKWIIGKEGYRHLFAGNKTLPELQATAAIPELIRNAVLADIHADRKGEMQVHEMWRLYAPLEIDGRTYRVKLTVKNRTDGVRQFHELDALQIENPAVNTQEVAAIGSTPCPVRPAGRSVISIAQLLADANRDSDGQPFAPEPSISATAQRFAIAPGTPPPNSAPAVMAISWPLPAYQAVKSAAILSRRSALMARPFPFPRR